jgi:hypothetical protein
MKKILAINLIAIFFIVSLSFSAEEFSLQPELTDVPNRVGYASNRIIVKFAPNTIGMLQREKFSKGKTGIPGLDLIGDRFRVQKIRPQFPNSQKKDKLGKSNLAHWNKIIFSEKPIFNQLLKNTNKILLY